jgi:DNA-binding transcriptional LysR family regulator
MDNRQLTVFRAVARSGNFTRAGEDLHLAQSAVSATVAALEADLGQKLFDRTTRRVILTAAGRALLPHATRILDAFRSARDEVEAVSAGLSGSVRIGYMTNVTAVDIPRLLGSFSRAHPQVSIYLNASVTGTAGLATGLLHSELDVAFLAASPNEYPDLRIKVLARSPLSLAVPNDHPLGTTALVRLTDVTGLRYIDVPDGYGTRTRVDREFRSRGIWRDVHIQTSDMTDAAALIRHGLGVGFLPKYVVDADPGLQWIEIEDLSVDMVVSVATARGRELSAAAQRIVDLASIDQGEGAGALRRSGDDAAERRPTPR